MLRWIDMAHVALRELALIRELLQRLVDEQERA